MSGGVFVAFGHCQQILNNTKCKRNTSVSINSVMGKKISLFQKISKESPCWILNLLFYTIQNNFCWKLAKSLASKLLIIA
jgi:hypothetical protein